MEKVTRVALSAFGAFAFAACTATADTNSLFRAGSRGENGGPGGGRRPPEMPLMKALDTNGDGVLDASEIAKASVSLKKLDKNGDGKLTRDELMPSRSRGNRGGGRGGPGGEGEGGQGGGQPPPGE